VLGECTLMIYLVDFENSRCIIAATED
jgi:hypothetical protein